MSNLFLQPSLNTSTKNKCTKVDKIINYRNFVFAEIPIGGGYGLSAAIPGASKNLRSLSWSYILSTKIWKTNIEVTRFQIQAKSWCFEFWLWCSHFVISGFLECKKHDFNNRSISENDKFLSNFELLRYLRLLTVCGVSHAIGDVF